MSPSPHTLPQLLAAQLQTLALTLRPGSVAGYRYTIRRFVGYLDAAFPQVRQPAQLCRDPHLLGWLAWLCQQAPPLSNPTRLGHLVRLRRLLDDLAANGHPLQPGLIRREDFPPLPQRLPRTLSPEEDLRLQRELRRTGDVPATALLLTRATGMRIGECLDLAPDCLRQLGLDQWALHVPLGKLHTERLVPADPEVRQLVAGLLALRTQARPALLARAAGLLLPRGAKRSLYGTLRLALADAARRAGCTGRVTPHGLRHAFATEMIRLGVSLPGLMQLLGHHDIRMTLRYVQLTQTDLQREFHLARQNASQHYSVPTILVPHQVTGADLTAIRQSLAATRYLLGLFRGRLDDDKTRRKLQRLDARLLAVDFQLDHLAAAEK
jgi:site-specific recombinase XerD